jgi:hypothetical protein
MIKAILERQGFSVFIPLKKDEFDLLAIKQDHIIAIIHFKNKILTEDKFLSTYKKEIINLIDLHLPFNFSKEIWIETNQGLFSINVLNTSKITNEVFA